MKINGKLTFEELREIEYALSMSCNRGESSSDMISALTKITVYLSSKNER